MKTYSILACGLFVTMLYLSSSQSNGRAYVASECYTVTCDAWGGTSTGSDSMTNAPITTCTFGISKSWSVCSDPSDPKYQCIVDIPVSAFTCYGTYLKNGNTRNCYTSWMTCKGTMSPPSIQSSNTLKNTISK